MLTWSLGCTGFFDPISPPSISMARLEITSLAFMFDWVPEPVCQTTSGKCSSSLPSATSCAAFTMASPSVLSSRPSAMLVSAAARFTMPSARTMGSGWRSQPILKLPSERWACAPQYLSAATSIGPKVSVSVRVGFFLGGAGAVMRWFRLEISNSRRNSTQPAPAPRCAASPPPVLHLSQGERPEPDMRRLSGGPGEGRASLGRSRS